MNAVEVVAGNGKLKTRKVMPTAWSLLRPPSAALYDAEAMGCMLSARDGQPGAHCTGTGQDCMGTCKGTIAETCSPIRTGRALHAASPNLYQPHAVQAAAKRYKVTGTGKVMARSAGKQHFNEKMSRDDIRDASKM